MLGLWWSVQVMDMAFVLVRIEAAVAVAVVVGGETVEALLVAESRARPRPGQKSGPSTWLVEGPLQLSRSHWQSRYGAL